MAAEARQNGSLTLYLNGTIVKTIKLGVGDVETPIVSFINGEIVLAGVLSSYYEQLTLFKGAVPHLQNFL